MTNSLVPMGASEGRNGDTFIAVCDPHLSPRNPSAWKVSYEDFTFDVWRQLFAFAEKVEASGILVAGDFFHRKRENDLSFLVRLVALFRESPVPVLGIAGNHDLATGSWTNGNGPALEMLFRSGAVHELKPDVAYGWPNAIVAGAGWDHGAEGGFLALSRFDPHVPHIHLGHFAFDIQGKRSDFFGEKVFGPADLRFGCHTVAVIGHHHFEQGVREVDEKTYVIPGSITWTSRHKADANRRLAAALLEVKRGKVTAKMVRPRVPAFEDVIDVAVQEQVLEEADAVERYVTELAEASFDMEDPVAELKADEALPSDVRKRALDYLEAAE